ncbi:HAMP domain-containing sensor histidine kinase [Marivirga salinae]|uniref:histidine kinase n=1 Tax=Marivirga salinarum TaxID=3059078 RepID=A0AA49JGN8_9BACT|nr:HAMP domain-containing sensor histidine kinase [Marivirga sp. BDSF4-3]WKK75011.2 HAMP domain-containing sensor histidine kinase [Marivirga sp. BDSF4-3]
MIQNFQKDLKENLKRYVSVDNKMEANFEAFKEFFENGYDPMFIIDLGSNQFLNVNQQFVKKHSEFQNALALFEVSIEETFFIEGVQFEQNDKVFLFNPIFRNEGKALIQILELTPHVNSHKLYSELTSDHFFEELLINKDLLNKLPSGIVHTNRNFESLWYNEKFNSLFGREIEKNFNFIDAIYVKNISQFWDKIAKLNEEGGQVSFSFVIHNVKQSDEIFINATAFPVGHRHSLEEGFIFILEDKTENLNFSEEITKQNLALNQINHELDKFLYSVSHNIRGPIASLEGLLKVIEISDVQTVNELKYHLRLNLRLLNSFVSDISNVATNIHTHVNFEKVNLRDVIEQMVLFVNDIYDLDPKIHFEIPTTYTIKTDADRLGIIIKCLLKNCFQYRDTRKEQLEIQIKVTQNEDFHLIEITDNGIGISEKVKPYIFDMFYRGTELSSGNGMGLYNSREILKKLGGTMNIESNQREWTKAKIYLPVNV